MEFHYHYHDSFIFNGSNANRFFSENTNGVKLLGDGGKY